MWQYMNEHGWWLGFGVIHMALFWGLIVLAIIAVVKIIFGGREENRDRELQPLEILQMRYARGEIGTEEYHRRKETLGAR